MESSDREKPFPDREKGFSDRETQSSVRKKPLPDRKKGFSDREMQSSDRKKPFPDREKGFADREMQSSDRKKLSVVTITDGDVITINEGKRSAGSGGRGIGIRVCVGRREYPMWEKFQPERPAKKAGRASR